jgi:hypothetical protein
MRLLRGAALGFGVAATLACPHQASAEGSADRDRPSIKRAEKARPHVMKSKSDTQNSLNSNLKASKPQ